ncbi:universal stress protein [Marmoricola sp. URHB0036]|uniref:universal stress protein n=1 Tax=Marmoricola sp. URHB0036 TaxID=1298863 RepID=UPI00041D5BEB|nr:universal stress protein [Marmoricola sp. URHB0036]
MKHFAAPGNSAADSVRPIVVGVNGSSDSVRALEWAVVRAYAGQAPLRIVHVAQPALWLDPFAFTAYWDAGPLEGAQALLEDAVQWARSRAPFLQVSAVLCRTNPATALLNEGRTADLIVLGRGHGRRLARWFDPSVAAGVARQARGRVVIVGHDDEVLY